MTELTYADAQENGIDTSMIKVCKKLRKLANMVLHRVKDNLALNYKEH